MSGIIINPYIYAGESFSNTKSLAFDGIDDYVDCGHIPAFSNVTKASFSFWLNRTTTTPGQIFGINVSSYNRIGCLIQSDDIKFYLNGVAAQINNFITINGWYHIAIVYDYSESVNADKIKIYLNGVSTSCGITVASSFPALDANLKLGTFTTSFLTGNLDEFAGFANVALTQSNINDIYNSGVPNDLTSLSPTVWYRMGDNSTFKSPQILMPENTNIEKVSNYSMDFDGVDDNIDCGDFTAYDNGDLSCSFWIYRTTSASNDYLISNTASNFKAGFDIQIDSSERLKLRRNTRTKDCLSGWTTSGITVDNWYHIAITYDETANEGKIYVNAVLKNTIAGSLSTNSASTDLKIGSSTVDTSFFTGNIDEVAIWDSVLSAGDVTAIYNSGEPTTITGAVAYWKLGEEAKFTDNWLVPNSALDNYSKFSFAFDGVDDYVNMDNPAELQITGALTISCWVKSSDTTDYVLVQKDNVGVNRSYALWGNEWGVTPKVCKFIIFNGGVQADVTGATDINDGNWHNVVAVFNPSTSLSIYIDGSLDAQNTTSIPATIDNDPAPFQIGRAGNGAFYMDGNLSDVAVWNSDQSSNIATIYNSGQPADLTSLSPVAWYRMGENASFNTNWTIPDQVASNDGTSVNMTVGDLEGEAPNYSGSGVSNAMTIEDRVGDAPNSDNNSVSYNMTESDIETETP